MKKILHSIGSIAVIGGMLLGMAAMMNSTDVTGETFATGVIDLKIDNESYVTDESGKLVFSPSTSWSKGSLEGKLFFNFEDLKPGDIGEDTISLHVSSEKAWSCMKVAITSTPENGVNEPEALADLTSGANQGELQNGLQFGFWADDGDNVFENDEKIFKRGLAKDIFNGEWWTLADSETNIWQKEGWNYSYHSDQKWNKKYSCEPIPEKSVKYVGKIWCFGNLTENPLSQDGKGPSTSSGQVKNGPLVRGTGWKCNGLPISNEYQSDGIKVDVSLSAVQSKDNKQYVCGSGGGSPDPTDPPNSNPFPNLFSFIKKLLKIPRL